jgi:ankyrin repeat protein
LMLAAHAGHLDIVKYLAGEKAASVDAAQEDGGTALLSAAHGHLDIVKYLAGERAACVDAAQGDDITPLMPAEWRRD